MMLSNTFEIYLQIICYKYIYYSPEIYSQFINNVFEVHFSKAFQLCYLNAFEIYLQIILYLLKCTDTAFSTHSIAVISVALHTHNDKYPS